MTRVVVPALTSAPPTQMLNELQTGQKKAGKNLSNLTKQLDKVKEDVRHADATMNWERARSSSLMHPRS